MKVFEKSNTASQSINQPHNTIKLKQRLFSSLQKFCSQLSQKVVEVQIDGSVFFFDDVSLVSHTDGSSSVNSSLQKGKQAYFVQIVFVN
jgi:hypothetical protein